jgi:hypothetical protein
MICGTPSFFVLPGTPSTSSALGIKLQGPKGLKGPKGHKGDKWKG